MFSVIIPAYNRESEIKKCLDSVLSQTFEDFEVIVVDNGSTDKTKQVVAEYVNKDSRVNYYWQENSGSPAGSRNTGIRFSKREWIAFLDSDDYWLPEKLAKVKEAISSSNTDLVIVSHFEEKHVDGRCVGVLKHGQSLSGNNNYHRLLFDGNSLSTSAVVAKRDAVIEAGLFDTRKEYFAVEDYDLWLRLSKLGSITYIDKVLGVFVIEGSNMSSNIELINNNLKVLIENHIRSLGYCQREEKKLLRQHTSRVDYYKGRSYLLTGDLAKAREILWKSLCVYPWSAKKLVSYIFSLLGIVR
ncbi:glycosyltransferase family 2 protein [Thaumasiovibrio subtropicus]|uniref:glycosyltransferase family 2 protein n=1 Tax=Thaumasiovibrio subtropicus TaxID=1891207 RepID=UPI00131CAC08|nr:glycosyltransferase family A protein [Thaumasiovibrio subtropicus]